MSLPSLRTRWLESCPSGTHPGWSPERLCWPPCATPRTSWRYPKAPSPPQWYSLWFWPSRCCVSGRVVPQPPSTASLNWCGSIPCPWRLGSKALLCYYRGHRSPTVLKASPSSRVTDSCGCCWLWLKLLGFWVVRARLPCGLADFEGSQVQEAKIAGKWTSRWWNHEFLNLLCGERGIDCILFLWWFMKPAIDRPE